MRNSKCIARLSHRLSVCPSVTLVKCIKTMQVSNFFVSKFCAPLEQSRQRGVPP